MLRICNIAAISMAVTLFTAPLCGQPYSLKLNALITPESQGQGLFLKARIDSGPELRMLLDSGAQHVVLARRTAVRLGRPAGSAFDLVGLGGASRACRRTAPGAVQIGDLTLSGCEIVVVDDQILDGIDGIIPLSLFADFLVRLDLPHRVLELDAYPPDPPAHDANYLAARADGSLLFLQTTMNESHAGYVLLDTGATYNAVSPEAARASRNYWSLNNAIGLVSSAGAIEGFPLPPGVRFRFGPRVLSADPAVVVDLSEFARRHAFGIAGILGFPALRHSIVTVDYRDSLVRIEGK
jgi:predicted aspartyl protease